MLTAWKLAPALAAGNTVVIKPSEFTSASTLEFIKLVEQAGFPKGVVNVVTGFGPEAGEALVKHELVRKVAFTGSSQTGSHIYSEAAKDIKRVSLELGGKSPNIVFADANLDNAVKGAVAGIFAATGQTCVAGSRLLVQESIHNEFVDRLVQFASTARMGNPMDHGTQVGPVTNLPQYEKVLGYIDIAKSEGVETVLGGAKADGPSAETAGSSNRPSLPGCETTCASPGGGLRAGAGRHPVPRRRRGHRNWQRRRLRTGGGYLDGEHSPGAHHVQAPAGGHGVGQHLSGGELHDPLRGYKRSGLGRELGQEAIGEYLQTKSVWISTAEEMANPFVVG